MSQMSHQHPTATTVGKLAPLPNGWLWATVKQLGDVVTGSTPSKQRHDYFGGEIPFIKPTDLNAGYYVRNHTDSLTQLGSSQAKLLPPRTVLVTCIGATIGKTGLARIECATNQQINALVTLRDSPLPEWCYWAFVSSIGQEQIKSNASATTLPILNKSKFESVFLPVAPPNEQRRIIAKIEELFSELDAGVAALERAKANLKRYRASVLKAAVEGQLTAAWRAEHPETEPASKLLQRILTERRRKWETDQLAKFAATGKQPPKNWKEKYEDAEIPDPEKVWCVPTNWCWTTIDATAFVTKLAGFEYTEFVKYDPNGDLAVLKAENAGKHGFKRTEFSRVNSDTVKHLTRSRLIGGEVLIAFVGNVGQVGLVPNDQPYFLGPNVGLIRIGSSLLLPEYLELFLKSPLGFRLSLSFAKAVTQPSLSMTTIRQIPVACPALAEQRQVVALVDERLSQITAAETQIDGDLVRASRLRQSILKQAFEGKLVPQDPADEPATVLLAKRDSLHKPNGMAAKSRKARQ